jgi:exodeoxyribonuclease VII large subunit
MCCACKNEQIQITMGLRRAVQPLEQTRKVLSVSELTGTAGPRVAGKIGRPIWVTGEITNLRAQVFRPHLFHAQGRGAQLSCVCSAARSAHRELLADGQKVLLQGDVTVYEARGQYQLIVRAVELQGVGALQIQFEKLKQKLAAEGCSRRNGNVRCRNIRSASAS